MKKQSPAINICVSHGNSFIKIAVYKNGRNVDFLKIPSGPVLTKKIFIASIESLKSFKSIKRPLGDVQITLALCSTKKGVSDFYSAVCKKKRFDFIDISCGLNLPVKINYDPPDSLGVDRICAAAAAVKKYGSETDALAVIDFGTATTFNLIIKGVFSGGLIVPGFGLYKNALGDSCDFLYRVHYNRISGFLCRDTKSALTAGIYGGYPILINGVYKELLSDARLEPKNVTLITCGGNSNFFTANIAYPVINDQMLVLDGINIIAGMNKKSDF